MKSRETWDLVIKPKRSLFDFDFAGLWKYRDLLFMFVKRDVITVYKQTILGPIWFVIQPIMTMFVYIVVFGNIAGISTDGLPKALFYLNGIILWNYFHECFMQTADTFNQNQNIFGKVYFPRMIMPLSKVVSGLIKFFIQLLLFLAVYGYYLFQNVEIQPSWNILWLPVMLLLMAIYGLGLGLIFTSLTTKYRDLKFFLQFGTQLFMYATPIIYPVSYLSDKMKAIVQWNPLSHIIEGFRFAFLGVGEFSYSGLLYTSILGLSILFIGIITFNKVEKTFMDTI